MSSNVTFFKPLAAYLTAYPNKLRTAKQAIEADFITNTPTPKTTSEKVQTLLTHFMDGVSFAQTASIVVFTVSTISYAHSYFSTFANMVSPFILTTGFCSGALFYDSHKTYQAMKSLNDWVIEKYPNHSDAFIINDDVYNRWRIFTTELKYNTWIIEPIARTYIEQATQLLAKVKQSFTIEHLYKGIAIIKSPDNNWQKAAKISWVSVTSLWRIVRTPLYFLANLWTKMDKKTFS